MIEKPKPTKQFLQWIQRKIMLQSRAMRPSFKEGEIWWAAIGENIGIEINGKNRLFSRPILVLRKYSTEGLFAIPLTSQPHSGSWYTRFNFQGNLTYAALSQARTLSVFRLYDKIGEASNDDLERVRSEFINLIQG